MFHILNTTSIYIIPKLFIQLFVIIFFILKMDWGSRKKPLRYGGSQSNALPTLAKELYHR